MGEGVGLRGANFLVVVVLRPMHAKGARVCPFTSDEIVVFMVFIPDCALNTEGLGEDLEYTKYSKHDIRKG